MIPKIIQRNTIYIKSIILVVLKLSCGTIVNSVANKKINKIPIIKVKIVLDDLGICSLISF